MAPVEVQLASQFSGAHSLGDAAQDQDDRAGAVVNALQSRTGEGVEDPATRAAPIIHNRRTAAAMNPKMVGAVAVRAGHPLGVRPGERLGITGVFIRQIAMGKSMVSSPLGGF